MGIAPGAQDPIREKSLLLISEAENPLWYSNGNMIISCSPTSQLKDYAITFDNNGNIFNSTAASNSTTKLADLAPDGELKLLHNLFQTYIGPGISSGWSDNHMENLPYPSTWLGYMISTRRWDLGSLMAGVVLTDREVTVDDIETQFTANATAAFEEVYPVLFATFLSIYADVLLPKPAADDVNARVKVTVTEARVPWRVSFPWFIVSVAIMAFFWVIVGVIFWRRPGGFMVHLPTNIAATLVDIYAGRWIWDLRMQGWRNGKRGLEVDLDATDVKFGYGRFVGADGHWHVGIDKEPVERLEKGRRAGSMWKWR